MDKFSKFYFEKFITSPIDMLCANFVKFGRQKISKVVRYLLTKKISPCSTALTSARIMPKSARASSTQCAQTAPDFLQIGSHSAELYSRTREHRQNVP